MKVGTPQHHIREIRRALADYVTSEGCTCCQNMEAHQEALNRLGKLLRLKKYEDGSGYDVRRYKTTEGKPTDGSK